MIVRYLTRRFIGDYEPNTGEQSFLFCLFAYSGYGIPIEIKRALFWLHTVQEIGGLCGLFFALCISGEGKKYEWGTWGWSLCAIMLVWERSHFCVITHFLFVVLHLLPIIPAPGKVHFLKSFIRFSPGNLYSRLVHVEGDQVFLQIQDTPGCIEVQD